MLAPAFVVSYLLPSSLANWGTIIVFGIAILFASNVRGAFLKPLFLVMIMTRFHVCVENQAINDIWDERLSSASDKFRRIKENAVGFSAGKPATVAA